MKPLRYLFLLLGMVAVGQKLVAQPNWHFGVYAQYELDVPNLRSLQTKGIVPGIQLGLELEYPKSSVSIYATSRWERLREIDREILLFNFNTRESLWHDNLILGPGVMVSLGKRGRIHPLVGVEVFLGLPLRTMYELTAEGGSSGNVTFPSYLQVDGGAGIMAGWQVFTGLEGDLQEGWTVQFKAFYGRADQTYRHYYTGSEVSGVNLYLGNYMNLRLGLVYNL